MRPLSEWALRVVLPRSDRQHILDELDELHRMRTARHGREAADRWRERQIWSFVLRALPTFWWRRPLRGYLRVMAQRDRRLSALDILRQDLRFAWRAFLRRPGFALAAIVILGVGIGATTTIFTVVDTVVIRPLPYPEPGELVHFGGGVGTRPMLFTRWRDGLRSYEAVEAAWNVSYNLTGTGSPKRIQVSRVTPRLLSILGARPHLGRLLVSDDYRADATVGLLGYGFWQREWGGDEAVLGSSIQVEGRPLVVAGILSPEFEPPAIVTGESVDLWLPLDADSEEIATWSILSVVGRLEDGAGLRAAQEELNAFSAHLAEELPDYMLTPAGAVRTTRLIPLQLANAGTVARPLALLTWAVVLLLLIACANVANLLLAHGTARAREMALRGALGAGRGRILRQLLTESMVLALVGGVIGVGLAVLSIEVFRPFVPSSIPRIHELAAEPGILLIALAVSVATGLVFGMMPALHASRGDVAEALKEGGPASSAATRGKRARSGLVVAEIALSLVLLSSAGFLFRSLVASARVDPGFESESLVSIPLHLGSGYDTPARNRFTREVMVRLGALPGTEAVAAGLTAPFQYVGAVKCCMRHEIEVLGRVGADQTPPLVWTHPVTPGYFRTLAAKLAQGREFTDADEDGEGRVLILNEPLARYLFGAEEPLGRSVRLADWGTFTVVGVVRGVWHWGAQQGVQPEVYVPYAQWGAFSDTYHLLIRSTADLSALAPAIRETVWAVDPGLPVEEIVPMIRRVEASLVGQRFLSGLLAAFALVSLLLATGGVYASMLFSAGQRRQEMGIRMAMGAGGAHVVGLVLRSGLSMTATGMVIGLPVSVGVARLLRGFLYGVSPMDPLTLGGVAVLLAGSALLACLLPALKAARADPLETLKAE